MDQIFFMICITVITAGVTILLRSLPFLLFSSGKKCPDMISFIGKILSPAAIAILSVYSLISPYRIKSFSEGGFGIPEAAAGAVVILLHLWKNNPMLSIISGTTVYMFITQNFF